MQQENLKMHVKLKFVYHDGSFIELSRKDFAGAIRSVFEVPGQKQTPIKVIAMSTGMVFYFDDSKFKLFLNNEITLEDLISQTQCQGIYKNTCVLDFGKNDLIEVDHLWLLKNGNYILVDEDRYVPVKAPDENFVEV